MIVVERGGDVRAHASAEQATAHIEPHDVDEGEYAGVFGLDGTVYELSTRGDDVLLRPTTVRDPTALATALEQSDRHAPGGPALDPVALANEELEHQWEHRWPRWPAWLDARLHGEPPPLLVHPPAQG